MGIPPFFSPEELQKFKEENAQYKNFWHSRGYSDCYNLDATSGYLTRSAPFVTPDGKKCKTADQYYKIRKMMPLLEKDGVCYGYYEVALLEDYNDPRDDFYKFFRREGYERDDVEYDEDYMKNIERTKEIYEKTGNVFRWRKGKLFYTERELINTYNYKYPTYRPIWQELSTGNWYFYDDVYLNDYGPYPNYLSAKKARLEKHKEILDKPRCTG